MDQNYYDFPTAQNHKSHPDRPLHRMNPSKTRWARMEAQLGRGFLGVPYSGASS